MVVCLFVYFFFLLPINQRNSDVYSCTSNREVVRSRNTDGNSNDPTLPLVSYDLKQGRVLDFLGGGCGLQKEMGGKVVIPYF